MDATPFAGRSLHFVGIGGAGMSGLARVAHSLGARVTGSDQSESAVLERLRAEGIEAIAMFSRSRCFRCTTWAAKRTTNSSRTAFRKI